ncbi:hypothetical protein C7S13_8007 [Burkholderia cepacia]|nr:hypothetical protein [Burkholderia cepacia]
MIDIGADLSDNDVHALYSYFMHAVKPVGELGPATNRSRSACASQ